MQSSTASAGAAHPVAWRAAWLLLVAASALAFLANNDADNDLWVHLRTGLDILALGAVPRADTYSYTVPGAPWVDHEWLTHVAFAAVYRFGGSPGLLLLKLGLGTLTVALLYRQVARQTTSPHVRGVLTLLAVAVLARGFAIRPQITSYAGVALLLTCLDAFDAGRRWPLWAVPTLLVLWANTHGAVILGVAIAGLCALWRLAFGERGGFALGVAVAAGTAAALMLNPYGPALATYLWHELSAPHPITEWQPVAIEAAQATFFALTAVLLLAVPFIPDWRRLGWRTALSLLLVVAAWRSARHTPLVALCAPPVAAAGLDQLRRRWQMRPHWRLSAGAQGLLIAGIIGMAAWQAGSALHRLGRDRLRVVYDTRDYPAGAVRYLRTATATGNAAVPLEWGGYVLWHLAPGVKVSLDGRFATVYPPSVVEDNFAFFSGRDDWKRLLTAYPTDMIIAPSAALPPVQSMPDWRRCYADDVATVYVRRGSPAGALPAATASTVPAIEAFP